MFKALRKRLHEKQEGFTLIELMVVVLIIAILIAIAIPTFLGAKKRAQDKQAQSNLRNGLTAEKTLYVDKQEYSAVAADLNAVEPSLDFTTRDAALRGVLPSVPATGAKNWVLLDSLSKSGTTFCILDIGSGANAGTYFNKVTAGTACPAGGDPAPAGYSKDVTVGW